MVKLAVRRVTATGLLLAALSSCGGGGGQPPTAAIVTPTSGAPLSGTVAVQVSVQGDGASRVQVYARSPGGTETGALLGSAVRSPYVIAVDSAALPNRTEIELYALVDSPSGEGFSLPVRVRAQHADAPELRYLVAYTMPKRPTSTLAVSTRVQPQAIRAPASLRVARAPGPELLRPQAQGEVTYLAEWAWNTLSDASGYRVQLSREGVAGPYEVVHAQSPASSGIQKYSGDVNAGAPGRVIAGSVTALTGPSLFEGPRSNADTARFLPGQEVVSPADGQSVVGGRPTLTWVALAGAQGYLYQIYDRDPYDPAAKLVWTNGNTVTTAQSAAYPGALEALSPGTYHWWVAGVAFDALGASDAFSFSEPRRFVVP